MTVRVRFAPSPTGYLHIGGARTALFNWMFARKHGGDFILRIEDTDQSRYVEGAIENLLESLKWLGLDWDEGPDVGGNYGPYTQSERTELYRKWADYLLENGHAYKDFTTKEELAEMRAYQKANGLPLGYDRRHRDLSADEIADLEAQGLGYTVRFKAPLDGQTVIPDLLRGDIVFENNQIQDNVLLKSDGFPTYHLANVVDDHFMQITHIMRGEEWISSAPLHKHLYDAFGWNMPNIAHLSVILSPSGRGKLSKRDQAFQDGDSYVLVKTLDYAKDGFLPEATINWLANIGWNYGDDVEIFDIADAIQRFTIPDMNPAPTKLPFSKLEWLNGQYIQALEPLELAKLVKPYLDAAGIEVNVDALIALMPAMSVRMKRLPDALEFLQFLDDESWQPEQGRLTHKKLAEPAAVRAFSAAREFIAANDYDLESLGGKMREIGEQYTDNQKAGPFLGTMRYAVTGQQVSPPLFESIMALGKTRTLARLDGVLARLDSA